MQAEMFETRDFGIVVQTGLSDFERLTGCPPYSPLNRPACIAPVRVWKNPTSGEMQTLLGFEFIATLPR